MHPVTNTIFAPLGGYGDSLFAEIYGNVMRKRHNSLRGLVIVAKIRLVFSQLLADPVFSLCIVSAALGVLRLTRVRSAERVS